MHPLDFLDTAAKLLTSRATEANIRTAISRSYYAVLLYVREWWEASGFKRYKDASAHTKIREGLLHAGIPEAEPRGRDMMNLYRNRRGADYDLTLRFKLKDGQEALERARRCINAFDAMDKTRLENGVRDYLRRTHQL